MEQSNHSPTLVSTDYPLMVMPINVRNVMQNEPKSGGLPHLEYTQTSKDKHGFGKINHFILKGKSSLIGIMNSLRSVFIVTSQRSLL